MKSMFSIFGTASQVLDWVKATIASDLDVPIGHRLRYVAIDFTHVENMDYSGAKTFKDISRLGADAGWITLFTGMNQKVRAKLDAEHVLDSPVLLEFIDLDHAFEHVEESLLQRASFVRQYWLMFTSFRNLHTQSLLKATNEIFEAVLGSELGNRLWRYAQQIHFKKGDYLCREGHVNHTLYLLQRGKVTSWTEKTGGGRRRLHTMRRGAFINDECLFLDLPVSYSTVADQDCIVWAIDRQSMKDLEAHDPFLAAEILRNILRVSSIVKSRLEREVSAIETSTLPSAGMTTSQSAVRGVGGSILKEMRSTEAPATTATEDIEMLETMSNQSLRVTGVGMHHMHHFQHVSGMLRVPSSPVSSPRHAPAGADDLVRNIRPHLSGPMRQDAMECFVLHATAEEQGHQDQKQQAQHPSHSRRRARSYSRPAAPVELALHQEEKRASAVDLRRISIQELQRAVMDLGFFPSKEDVLRMHQVLGPSASQRLEEDDGVDQQEFLRIVEVLSLAELAESQKRKLWRLFKEHCDEDHRLWRDELESLMRALGHPEDELELELLMHEWDMHGHGYLDFDAFVSIVAHVMKAEELDEQVEADFLKLCGKELEDISRNKSSLLALNIKVTASDLVQAGRQYGMPIDPVLAQEMIFDADETGDGKVSLDELIATIEMVGMDEAMQDQQQGADAGMDTQASQQGRSARSLIAEKRMERSLMPGRTSPRNATRGSPPSSPPIQSLSLDHEFSEGGGPEVGAEQDALLTGAE